MASYEMDDLIDSIYNPNGNQNSLPDVILENLEIELLKALANGKNLQEINSIIKIYSKTETFNSISMRLLEKLEAFTLAHAVLKVIKMGILNFK